MTLVPANCRCRQRSFGTSVTEWKWAVTHVDADQTSASWVAVEVYNTCPSGGGPAVLVAAQSDIDYRKRIRLTAAEIGGRCLEARITALHAPPGGVTVYSADMFHGGGL